MTIKKICQLYKIKDIFQRPKNEKKFISFPIALLCLYCFKHSCKQSNLLSLEEQLSTLQPKYFFGHMQDHKALCICIIYFTLQIPILNTR